MKKKHHNGSKEKIEDLDKLLAEHAASAAPVVPKVTSDILKDFILYAFYYFNVKENKELFMLYVDVQKKFDQKFRVACQDIVATNSTYQSRKGQNKTIKKALPDNLPLQTSEENYIELCAVPNFGREVLKFLLKYNEGDSIDKRHVIGDDKKVKRTLLSIACLMNCPKLIDRLKRINVRFKYQEAGLNPLMVCVVADHIQSSKYLFKEGLVYLKSELAKTLVLISAFSNANTKMLTLLNSNGVVLENELESATKNRAKNPQFMLDVVKFICRKGESKKLLSALRLLCQLGYRVDGVDELGNSALSYASEYECYSVLEILLTEARVSSKRVANNILTSGGTVLGKFVAQEQLTLVELLLNLEVDPNLPKEKPHLRPLAIAQHIGNEQLVLLLEESDAATVDAEVSKAGKLSESIEIFMQRPLVYAITTTNKKLVAQYIDAGESITLRKYDIKSPIYYAMRMSIDAETEETRRECLELLEYLLDNTSKRYASLFHHHNFPPLHFCMVQDIHWLIPVFVKNDFAIRLCVEKLETPVEVAARENSVESLKVLGMYANPLFPRVADFISAFSGAMLRGHYQFCHALFENVSNLNFSEEES